MGGLLHLYYTIYSVIALLFEQRLKLNSMIQHIQYLYSIARAISRQDGLEAPPILILCTYFIK